MSWVAKRVVGSLALVSALTGAACQDDPAPNPAGTTVEGAGQADPAAFDARKLAWARFETAEWVPSDPVNVQAHLARKRLEPGYAPPGVVPEDAWDDKITKMDDLRDTRDFDALRLLHVVLSYGDDPTLSPGLVTRVDAALARFKFWFTQPTPPGKQDDSYYWSENHQVIYHTVEYLEGTRLGSRPMGTDGRPGHEHASSARKMLLQWLNLRSRFGFSEWHSNVYYEEDIDPLLALSEHAPDKEIRVRADAVLDVLFADLALHTLKGAFGVTHGRSYKKDKMMSTDDNTWGVTKILFDLSTYDHKKRDHGAAMLATNTRYLLPEVLRRIAADPSPIVDRERMSLPIQDSAPIDYDAKAAYGFSYSDPDDLMIWWGMGALTAYPVVPATLETFDKYDLWNSGGFAQFKDLQSMSPDFIVNLSAYSSSFLNFGLMKDVDTYTWRTPDVMLSSAIDYRKGTFHQQIHAWQATLDAKALVFTNHPFRPLATSGDWLDDSEQGGYWNGSASVPRSAQLENVAIHIYAPQYPKTQDKPFDYFHWEPYTHAYFPQEFFDEFAQDGNWTFGRKGDGYVGLYSYRTPEFLVYDGVTQATGGRTKPFDLIANGGADNVWIVECGRAETSGDFASWRAAVAKARVEVTSRGPGKPSGESDGFDVTYESPSKGVVTFGWEKPFVVAGNEVPLHAAGRYENPYSHVALDPKELAYEKDDVGLKFDIARGTRVLYGPR